MSKMSVFKKNKIVEFTILQSVLVALMFSIGSFGEINFFYILPPCILLSATIQLGFYAFYRIFYGKEYLEEIASQEDMFFAGSIEELTSQLYAGGLKLQSKAGEFYIFTPNYFLLPKHDILVIKSNGGYLVQSNHMVIKFLSEAINGLHGISKRQESSKVVNAS